jgi:GntR family transcriptional regulator
VARLSGPDGLTGNHNTFARRHAVAEIAGEFADGISPDALERATDECLGHASVQELQRTDSGERRFTTEELLVCERSILHGTVRRHDSMTAVIAGRFVDAAIAEAQPTLNADQAAAVRAVSTSGNGVDTVSGERLPPARELAATLKVNTNTVLRALRLLRDERLWSSAAGGASTSPVPAQRGAVLAKAREFVQFGRRHGYEPDELIDLMR